jgi:LysR family transcriptional activator of nhaA
MEWLNYHHLYYFWTVAKEGSVSRACRHLHLAQPTISGQIRALEESLGEKLFVRAGRGLALSEVGRTVYSYADEIFSLGREMLDILKDRPTGRPLRLVVGVADAIPKLIAHRLLDPALSMPEPVQVVCHEDKPERLLAELSAHGLDVVLTDAPLGPGTRIRAFNHMLGETGVSLFAVSPLAARFEDGLPGSLGGAPFLLPARNTTLRRSLDQWFDERGIRPRVVGEFDDSALLKAFGQAGLGIFAAHEAIETEIRRQYGVVKLGRLEGLRERFYAISAERRLKHPAVLAISETARRRLFG